jgi:hypothetical protein
MCRCGGCAESDTWNAHADQDGPQAEHAHRDTTAQRDPRRRPLHYRSALEIDHIVSLELGGSNDIANLFPEKLYAHPGYRIKGRLENRLHDSVCAGKLTLRAARTGIASNWQKLNKQVYG